MNTTFSSHLTLTDFSEAIKQLGEFVSIPSVSHPENSDYNKQHLVDAAEFAGSKLQELGFNVSYPVINESAPFVIAERIVNTTKPTLVLYAHYDIQPVDRAQWKSDPYVMEERDGRLYGRGASDDKGGIIAIITALGVCIREKMELPNVKILFEGEEEYGSLNMSTLLKHEAERLNAHALIVLDGMNRDTLTGTLTSSTRGIVNINLQATALYNPVHSGIGCLAPDPAQTLSSLIYTLRNPRDIPGFMEGSETLSETEREILKQGSISPETYAKNVGMKPNSQLRGDPGISVYERILNEPSISIINMTCGKPNGGNSIQDSANCTIGIRVLPGQDPDQIADSVIKYLRLQEVKFGVEVQINQVEKGSWAWKANLSGQFSNLYLQALKDNFQDVCAMPLGGALPLLHEFQQIFPKMEMIVPGVEDSETNAHSHNESQHIDSFKRSIESLIYFLNSAGKVQIKA